MTAHTPETIAALLAELDIPSGFGGMSLTRLTQIAVCTELSAALVREKALREALVEIDALDPEHLIDSCAQTAMRGLVLRMGEIARAALATEDQG